MRLATLALGFLLGAIVFVGASLALAWTGPTSPPPNGDISKPITGETTYTLSCLTLDGSTLTKSATVRIIPTFQEL